MSAHICPIVKLGPPKAIPGADNIEVFEVFGNGPVICVKGQFKEGDLAAFIPPESCVDTALAKDGAAPFEFLKKQARKSDGWAKIKPIRLRGQMSIGLLVHPYGLVEGENAADLYKVKKFEEHIKIEAAPKKTVPWYLRLWKRYLGTKAERGLWPGIPVYDINQLYKMRQDIFKDDELMIVTEKLHGTNARYVIGKDGKLWCGSRTMWRTYNASNVYGRAAIENNIESKLRRLAEPIVLWGEIVGPGIQKGFDYGLAEGQIGFYCFDMYHALERRFLDPCEVNDICHWLKIRRVPIDRIDKWSSIKNDLAAEAARDTNIDCMNPREGIVVRPYKDVKETHALDGSRCMVAGKVINPAYLEFREKPGMDEQIIL